MARNNEFSNMPAILNVMEGVNPKSLLRCSVSITGHLGRPRDEIIKLIREAGGEYSGSISERYGLWRAILITNEDWTPGTTVQKKASSKLLDARRRGATIISEKEFYDLITAPDEKK